ncbi:hypothetical protein ACOCJ5_07475 [Knoellia sp. CPCC 206450]|uniref:hypothetical protein n=1 Tax=Knoellia tibetensis TaxID=3404798 RepID=UPI003B433C1C
MREVSAVTSELGRCGAGDAGDGLDQRVDDQREGGHDGSIDGSRECGIEGSVFQRGEGSAQRGFREGAEQRPSASGDDS